MPCTRSCNSGMDILKAYGVDALIFVIIPARTSGTTVTFMIIEGWVITVASVGDSRCTLESAEGAIYYLSADHRLECNEEEYVVTH